MVHRREDLVASALYLNALIDRAYAAEHRRQSQLSPGFVASISETGTEKKNDNWVLYAGRFIPMYVYYGDTVAISQHRCVLRRGKKKRNVKFIKNIFKIFFMSQIARVCIA
jgi:hypothetical protein